MLRGYLFWVVAGFMCFPCIDSYGAFVDYDLLTNNSGFKFSSESDLSFKGMQLESQEKIFKKFDEGNDKIRVIIGLAINSRYAISLYKNATGIKTLKDMIAISQVYLISSINDTGFEIGYIYENFPSLSATVNEAALSEIINHPLVDSIEIDEKVYAQLKQGIPLIKADYYRSAYTGKNISIAILDAGVDYEHTYLGGGGFPNSKVIGGYDFVDNDNDPKGYLEAHGTACAGISAGSIGVYGDYIGGVAYDAKVYALRVLDDKGSGYNSNIIAAIDWCVSHKNDNIENPIKVISMSLGGGRFYSACDVYTSFYNSVQSAVNEGITVLGASGNNGYSDSIAIPACLSNVISVGAVYDANIGKASFSVCTDSSTAAEKITCYSNLSSKLDILAPSHNAYTLDITDNAGYDIGNYVSDFGGTSAACPYIAGAVAVLQHASIENTGRYLTQNEIKKLLNNTGKLISSTRAELSFPLINLKDAIEQFEHDHVILENNQTLIGLQGVAKSQKYYKINLPLGQQYFEVKTWDGTGDCDLYVRRGSIPTSSIYDQKSCNYGNGETIIVNNPVAGIWYIMAYGRNSYSGVSLRPSYWLDIPNLSISPLNSNYTEDSGQGSVSVTSNVSWAAITNKPWITITSGSYGTNNGTINYSIEANAGESRDGEIIISGGGVSSVFSIHQQSYVSVFPGGDGTKSSPYQISNRMQLEAVNDDLAASYVLVNDIDLSETTYNKAVIAPDGNEVSFEQRYSTGSKCDFQGEPFLGYFDGNGYVIRNLSIESDYDMIGLFGFAGWGSELINIRLDNCNISGSNVVGSIASYIENGEIVNSFATGTVNGLMTTGGLIGYSYYSSISNCHFQGNVEGAGIVGGLAGQVYAGLATNSYSSADVYSSDEYSGGLLGILQTHSIGAIVRNCYAIGSVTCPSGRVGGLIGYSYYGNIEHSYSYGITNGGTYAGGLVGINWRGKIENSYSKGNIVSNGYYVGGLTGQSYYDVVSSSYSIGNVNGINYVGGLIGSSSGSIFDCYAIGDVQGRYYTGGLVGSSKNISNSYCVGLVSGYGDNVGGLTGSNSSSVHSSFWDIEVSGLTSSDGGIGISTEQIKDINTFVSAEWSLGDIWMMSDISSDFTGLPILAWQQEQGYYILMSHDVQEIGSNGSDGILSIMSNVSWSAFTNDYWITIISGASGINDADINFSILPNSAGARTGTILITDGNMIRLFTINQSEGIYGGGEGTISSPYVIFEPSDLNSIGSNPDDWDKYFILAADIDMAGLSFAPIARSWESSFNGTFDGNGKTVYNLSIDEQGESLVSMFGNVGTQGVIKNLSLHNLNVTSQGGYFVGGIASWCNGVIENCSVKGNISGYTQVGGITAGLDGSGRISNCYTWCNLEVGGNLGGLIASDVYGGAVIEYCYAAGNISGEWIGGIAARADEGVESATSFFDERIINSALGWGVSNARLCQTFTYGYAGWDWAIWKQFEGDYPVFQWQNFAGDLNDDGLINAADLYVVASQWLDGQSSASDANGDGVVDLRDFVHISRGWIE